MRAVWRHAGTAVAVAVVVDSARRARAHQVGRTEEQVFRLVNDATDHARGPVWAIMQSGSLAAVFVVASDQYRRGTKSTAAASLIAGVMVWAGVKAIKPRIGRGRPERHLNQVSVRGLPQTGLGYPSGHAAVATTLALIATRNSTWPTRAAAIAVACVTGGARMYAGAHLPLDVAGGTAIGVLGGGAAKAILDHRHVWIRP